ncbi:outer membrane beta-barrel protein [Hymenobacter lutimineralis]|uniref:Outer membrane beta-barrel protein n=1 Tax=Hymenobacter lutimineralis TaxID=2606448 RepID=A0A5D6UTA5_9BACT|nr:TonB-dependent receptor [Hymenobacter lutimineralis]TYZ06786.1 outer membrane beta-barrel protein [Hymenobacter lutimineralis]
MQKALFLGIFLFFATLSSLLAQTTTVRGRVLDGKDQSPLIGANVVLTRQPGTQKLGTAVDTEGNFSITDVPAGTYQLTISFLGYQNVERTVEVTDQPLEVGAVPLQAGGVQLKGVEVTGRAPAAVQKGDTAQYDSRAFKTNPDANAQDLITKMPGVTVDANGKVQAQGEQVQRVLVDGKEFFGNDPDAVLKNIPAEIIDKIQVYDRASDQSQFTGFDDGNQQKTINIVTKPSFRNGQFGRVVAGYGPDQDGGKYRLNGNVNSFKNKRRLSVLGLSNNINEQNFGTEDLLGVVGNSRQGGGGRGGRGGGPGGNGGGQGGGGNNAGDFLVNQNNGISRTHALGLNYSNTIGTKTDVQGSYFFNLSDNTLQSTTARTYTADDLRYNEDSRGSSRNINNRLNLRIEHKFDSLNSLLWRPTLSVQRNTSSSTLAGELFKDFTEQSAPDSTQSTNNSAYRAAQTGINFSNNLLYRHRFAKRGRTFSLGLNLGYNRRNGSNYLTSSNIDYTSDPAAESLTDQYSRLRQNGWSWRADANYTEPLSPLSQLQFSATTSLAPNDSDKRTYNFDATTGQYTTVNTDLSNVFSSRYMTQSGGLSYRFNNKEFQWSVGADVQYATLRNEQDFPREARISRNFLNVLPNATLRYNFSKQQNLRLTYRMRTNNPNINQLQEVVNNANPLQITIGNAALEQEFQHNAFLRYSAAQPEKSSSFFALLGGSYTDNYITNSTRIVREPTSIGGVVIPAGGQITQPINLNQQYSLRSALTYGFPLTLLKSNLNLNASATYLQTPGLVNEQLNYNRTPAFGFGAALSSNISPELDFTLSSNSTQTYVRNSLGTQINSRYFRQNTTLRFSWIMAKGITLKSDVNHVSYSGLSAGFNQNFVLWNASLGKKLFAKQQGELQLYAFDLLGQNNSIQRNILPAYTEDVRTNILQRYLMLVFTYNLRSFGGAGNAPGPDQDRPRRDGTPGSFPGGGRPDGPGGPR